MWWPHHAICYKEKIQIFLKKGFVQGVPLILGQTLKGGIRHEDKHYSVGNYGEQTELGGLKFKVKTSNGD